jgi:hypothetical protein
MAKQICDLIYKEKQRLKSVDIFQPVKKPVAICSDKGVIFQEQETTITIILNPKYNQRY